MKVRRIPPIDASEATTTQSEMLDLRAAAAVLNLHPGTVRRIAIREQWPTYKIRQAFVYPAEVVRSYTPCPPPPGDRPDGYASIAELERLTHRSSTWLLAKARYQKWERVKIKARVYYRITDALVCLPADSPIPPGYSSIYELIERYHTNRNRLANLAKHNQWRKIRTNREVYYCTEDVEATLNRDCGELDGSIGPTYTVQQIAMRLKILPAVAGGLAHRLGFRKQVRANGIVEYSSRDVEQYISTRPPHERYWKAERVCRQLHLTNDELDAAADRLNWLVIETGEQKYYRSGDVSDYHLQLMQERSQDDRYLSPSDVAALLGCPLERVNALARRFGWKLRMKDGKRRFLRVDVQSYTQSRQRGRLILELGGWIEDIAYPDRSYDFECPLCGAFAVYRPPQGEAELTRWQAFQAGQGGPWPERCVQGHLIHATVE